MNTDQMIGALPDTRTREVVQKCQTPRPNLYHTMIPTHKQVSDNNT